MAAGESLNPALLAALRAGEPVLTANKRQARGLRQSYGQRCLAQGLAVWATPPVFPLMGWLEGLWSLGRERGLAGENPPLRLSGFQEQLVWEAIVQESPQGQGLLRPQGAAELAAKAGQLLASHLGPASWRASSVEEEAFLAWRAAFERRLAEKNWISAAACPLQLADWLGAGLLPLPPAVHLAGFDRLTPLEKKIIKTLAAQGCRVRFYAPPKLRGQPRRVVAADADEELALAAQWAAEWLNQDPQAQLALVVPDLKQSHQRVRRLLTRQLAPSALLAPEGDAQLPFNLSVDGPLAAEPVVAQALAWLEAALEGALHWPEGGRLLLSPFLAGSRQEEGPRARLEERVRDLGWERVSLERLAGMASQPEKPWTAPLLAKALRGLDEARSGLAGQEAPGGWARRFGELLKAVSWPGGGEGGRPLNSREYQAVKNGWFGQLNGLAGLEPVAPRLDGRQALRLLGRLVQQEDFQPQTGPAPLQVLGTLEAGGLAFDGLWLAGLHADGWPQPSAPHPLLPHSLQERLSMPHASPERELAFARRATARLLAAAPVAIVSHPAAEGERELDPSPLIAQLPLLQPAPRLWTASQAPTPLESFADPLAPPLPEGARVNGGAGLFADQAGCPFKAFAHWRLEARPLGRTGSGLNAAQRGELLHKALELFWDGLAGQASLAGMAETGRAERVAEVCRQALEAQKGVPPAIKEGPWGAAVRGWLARRVGEWLALELAGPEFTIEAREQKLRVEVGGIEVDTRIDRMDRVGRPDGAGPGDLWIYDYKTGQAKVSDWFRQPLAAPQLPLYCVYSPQPISGAAFAMVRAGEMKTQGVVELDGKVEKLNRQKQVGGPRQKPPVDPQTGEVFGSMAQMKNWWKAQLEGLAEDFRQGRAQVAPAYRGACDHCGLEPLCRVEAARQIELELAGVEETLADEGETDDE